MAEKEEQEQAPMTIKEMANLGMETRGYELGGYHVTIGKYGMPRAELAFTTAKEMTDWMWSALTGELEK